MLWISKKKLPWSFTKELKENDHKMVIFQEFLCKIVLITLSMDFIPYNGPQTKGYKGTALYHPIWYYSVRVG